jgi:prepilin-type N-terminal cleavage/methylation domain-containing protein
MTSRRALQLNQARPGFSIIELTVALVLIALIAGMAVPRLNYERFRADAAMRTVRAALQGAQRNAIMRQTNIVVAFNLANRTLEVIEDANNNCSLDSGERVSVRPLEDGAKFDVPPTGYAGTAVTAPIVGAGLCTIHGLKGIQFLRDGATSGDLDIYLASSRSTPDHFRLIRVSQASGRTEAWRFDGTTWQRTN